MSATSSEKTVEMPAVAVICTITAWLSIVIGGIAVFSGFASIGQPASSGEMTMGMTLLLSSVFWFAIARVITLLAQIAHNTRARSDGE